MWFTGRLARRLRVQQRGAAAIVLAVFTAGLLIPLAALAVDIGQQRVARRDVQALADTAALDAVRSLGSTSSDSSLTTVASHSVASDSGAVGTTPTVLAKMGYIAPAATWSSDQALGCNGSFSNSYFTYPVPAGQTANAVLVVVKSAVSFHFASGSGGVCRSSIANTQSQACFKLGSYAARLDTSTSPLFTKLLNGALGNISVSAVSYQGLATASVSLSALAFQLGLGTVNQLATTSVQVKSLMVAAATVLGNNGNTASATLLNSIAAQVTSTATVTLGNVLDLSSGGNAALASSVNVLDLISGAAFVANGTNAIAIDNLVTSLGLTGTNLTTAVNIIEGVQTACGPVGTTVPTAQGKITITGNLASVSTPSSLSGLSLSAGATGTSINVNLASATGTLTKIVCGAGTSASPQGMDVSVASQLVSASISQKISVSGSITTGSLLNNLLGSLLGTTIAISVNGSLTVGVATSQPGTTGSASIRVPNSPASWSTGVSTGSGVLGLSGITPTITWNAPPTVTVTSTILGIPQPPVTLSTTDTKYTTITSSVVSDLTNVLGGLVSNVQTSLLTPLENLLGIEAPGADVYGVPTPTCANPQLVG